MRKIALVVVAMLSMSAAFGPGKNFTASSKDFTTWIAVSGSEYDFQVVEKSNNLLQAQRRVAASVGHPADATVDAGERVYKMHVEPVANGLHAKLDVVTNGTISDWFNIYWDNNAPAGTDDWFRVGGDVKAPVVVNRVEPVYTAEAKQGRVAGIVIAEVLIDATGVVREARVLKRMPFGLDDSAIDAVRQWTFQPGTKDGQPVPVVFNLTVNFKGE